MCLLTCSFPGEDFPPRILSFHFSFFESPVGRAWARFCVPSRLSGATRDPLSSSLGMYFGRLAAQKLPRKRVLLDLANPSETCACMYGLHIAPPSLERGNRSEGQRCQNQTNIAPRALHESAGGAQKSFRSAPKSPRGGPMGGKGPPQRSIVPDFEIFWKIEIMRMISFFQAGFRLSIHRAPTLSRIRGCA